MLRITRRAGERVIIGDNIFLTVLEVSGQTVRLGIDAPRSVSIFREEIWAEVKRENEAAAEAAAQLDDLTGMPAGAAGAVSSVVPGRVSGQA